MLTKVFFTIGHPGETLAEARCTNRFIRRNRSYIRLTGYSAGVRIYPGTYVERYAREQNLLPPGFRWSKPYRNEGNRRLLRPVDSIPILLQPGLGLSELRGLRLSFVAMRIASPRYVIEKVGRILRGGSLIHYLQLIVRGLLLRSTSSDAHAPARGGPQDVPPRRTE
jgi:hypothetical protein